MKATLQCIVEGHGEVSAVPELLRRIASEIDCAIELKVLPPIRVDRSKILNRPQEFDRAIQLAFGKAAASAPPGAVLILLDAHDDCPADLGPDLRARALKVRSDIPCAVVLAKCEYESWFIAARQSLATRLRVEVPIPAPANPEEIHGAKEWLERNLLHSKYSPRSIRPACLP